MRSPVPIDRRLSETRPATVSEALLVSVVQKHKQGLAPSLPASTMKRIERTLGEHPPRPRALPVWRVLRTVAAVLAVFVAVQAVAVMGIRLVEVVKVHFAQKKAGQIPARDDGLPHGSGVITAPPAPLPLPSVPPAVALPNGSAPPELTTSPRPPTLSYPARRLDQPLPPPPSHMGVLSGLETSHPAPSAAQPTERPSRGPDPLDMEAAQLKRGLELKRAGDLIAAVATLKQYRQTHPRGAFWIEASMAELDAQLSLGHREEALSILEAVGDDPALPRSAELRLLRAELAARRGRCPEALAGFAASLQIPSLAERALYGKASCQEALGRFSESRSGFEEYLARYPQGSLATEARRALGSSR